MADPGLYQVHQVVEESVIGKPSNELLLIGTLVNYFLYNFVLNSKKFLKYIQRNTKTNIIFAY